MSEVATGQLITFDYEDRPIEAIVIDPNGLGDGKPSVGMGLGMTERYVGIPQSTLSTWLKQGNPNNISMTLKLPSGKHLEVIEITDSANNKQLVIEASQWIELAADLLKRPGKTRKETLEKVVDFLTWFAVKGFYASAYVQVKGGYTRAYDAQVSQLLQENAALESQLSEVATELAIAEHRIDKLKYERDELMEIAQWRRELQE